jgi:hypothetical protein
VGSGWWFDAVFKYLEDGLHFDFEWPNVESEWVYIGDYDHDFEFFPKRFHFTVFDVHSKCYEVMAKVSLIMIANLLNENMDLPNILSNYFWASYVILNVVHFLS